VTKHEMPVRHQAKIFMRPFIITLFVIAFQTANGQSNRRDFLVFFVDTATGTEMYGYKTPKGKVAIPARYENVATDTFYTFAFVYDDRGWVGINRKDSVILKPFIFDNFPDEKRQGLFRFEEDGKMGFANDNGKKVIPARYDFVMPFKNGYAAFNIGGQSVRSDDHSVWEGGLWGLLDRKGNVVLEPQITQLPTTDKYFVKARTKNGATVYINNYGQAEKVIPKKK
jgi:hypothetical protein